MFLFMLDNNNTQYMRGYFIYMELINKSFNITYIMYNLNNNIT